MQLLATRGYAVPSPDIPSRRETVPSDLLKMVMPGVERVVDMGIADSDRVGVMGHSFGGYSVVSLIVQTNRFKAAVASAGSGDLVSRYGDMRPDGSVPDAGLIEDGQQKLGGPPWAQPLRYVEQSPVFYLDRVETPLLMVTGAEDEVTPPKNIAEVFVGLRRLDKEAVFILYEGEKHAARQWGFANAVDYCTRIIDWFDTHIGSKTPSRGAGGEAR